MAARGHLFHTHSDTEVVLHAWEEWQESCVERFRGMFAFGILDWCSGRLFLARDHFGIKPLYFCTTPDSFAFASEITPLRLTPGFRNQIDLEAVDQYLWLQYIPAPRSIYQQIQKLLPGCSMTLDLTGRVLTGGIIGVWRSSPKTASPGKKRWIERADQAINESVRAHLVADLPFGAFLSGGVDPASWSPA